jgi:ribose-phosphate pyrophosphokinase
MVKHNPEYKPTRVLLRPKDSAGFLAGIFWVQSLTWRGANPELVIPCLFGQRQDRVNPTGDTLFTAKSVGKLINSLNLPKVYVLDPHSDVSSSVIDRCLPVGVDEIWMHHLGDEPGDYQAVIAPDVGAAKRASKVADLLKLPLRQGFKKRDVASGKLAGFGVESMLDLRDPEHPNYEPKVLVVDDLCDGGGTFIGLADELDREGVRADLFVTHGIFSKGTADLRRRYERLICTDSVISLRPDVEILFTAEELLTTGDLA